MCDSDRYRDISYFGFCRRSFRCVPLNCVESTEMNAFGVATNNLRNFDCALNLLWNYFDRFLSLSPSHALSAGRPNNHGGFEFIEQRRVEISSDAIWLCQFAGDHHHTKSADKETAKSYGKWKIEITSWHIVRNAILIGWRSVGRGETIFGCIEETNGGRITDHDCAHSTDDDSFE